MAWLGRVRQKKPIFVSSTEAAYDLSTADGGFHDKDDISQLYLKCAVEVLKASDEDQTIRIRQLRKHLNLSRVLELQSGCHGLRAKPDCKEGPTTAEGGAVVTVRGDDASFLVITASMLMAKTSYRTGGKTHGSARSCRPNRRRSLSGASTPCRGRNVISSLGVVSSMRDGDSQSSIVRVVESSATAEKAEVCSMAVLWIVDYQVISF
ncbi:hypothetical protein ACFX2F_022884 [Malus domestica]